MTEPILWSILIATLASREVKFMRLINVLLPQAEEAGCIEIVACSNNGEIELGRIRQGLLTTAKGEYVSYCDDDDMVPDYFVEEIIPALRQGPDVVGFYMNYYESGQFIAESHHSITHGNYNDVSGFYRDVSHQQPVLTKLAKQADFRAGWPEDNFWKTKLRPLLKNEIYIDKLLYHYYHDNSDTVQGHLQPHTYTPRPEITSPIFRWLEVNDID